MADKTYIKVNGVWREADSVYRKRNGAWHKASDDVYKMINGAWVNQGDKSAIFDPDALFVYNDFRVDENVSAHVDVTCFDGGDGSVTVVASGGTPPYQYSLDPTFATYNTDGVFSNLSITGPVTEGTDNYGGILICTKTIYVKDANNHIVSLDVQLKSPVELDWLYTPAAVVKVFCDPGQDYATNVIPTIPITTRANAASTSISGTVARWRSGRVYPVKYTVYNDCGESIVTKFNIEVIPLYLPNAIQDYDGNWYDAVVIGNQVWLASNLRTTHYVDGTAIPAGGSTTSDTDPYYYDYSTSNIPLKDRGYLYNFPAVMNGESPSDLNPSGVQGIAPNGWHVPSDAEWTQLTNYVGSVPEYILDNNNTYIAKALAAQNYWNASADDYAVGNDLSANNKTLFGVVPAGDCTGQSFAGAEIYASMWSSSLDEGDPLFRNVTYNSAGVGRFNFAAHEDGYSVRCVCDLSPLDFAAWYYNQYGSYNHQIVV